MAHWKKTTHHLRPDHGWRASPGYKLIVLGRGLMQFEYPHTWIVIPGETSFKLHDRTPPHDDIVLEVSILPLPPVDWKRVSLPFLLQDSQLTTGYRVIEEKDIHKYTRPDLQVVWCEYRAMEQDPAVKEETLRECVWRQAMCQSGDVFSLMTFGCWSEFHERAAPVWDHILHSIVMDRYIEDPTAGPKLH